MTKLMPVQAETAQTPALVISQLKITSSNGQFITLYNTTDSTLDMSKYQLQYFNNYDLTKATSSKLITLSGSVPPRGYYMVNDSALLLCYQLTINSVSLGLSSTAGLVAVQAVHQAGPGGSITPVLQDYVGWSRTTAVGAQTLPANVNAFLLRQPVDDQNNPAIAVPGAGTWQTVQPDQGNPCELLTASGVPGSVATGLNQLLPATEPPATIITSSGAHGSDIVSLPFMPPGNIGLMAPQITELLPNPMGTGNDSTDEFIELYNANPVAFDLSGFSLQAGLTTTRTYKFPSGTMLPPSSFTAFHSSVTSLSLSNSGGQVKLLDPFGNSLAASEVYGTAKDGQGWALAKGKWYWTLKLTPGAANVINEPPAKKTAAKTAGAKKTKSSAAKTKAAKTSLTKAATAAGYPLEGPPTTPIHIWTFALIAGLALLYGIYEYRADLANRFYLLRRYFGRRRDDRT